MKRARLTHAGFWIDTAGFWLTSQEGWADGDGAQDGHRSASQRDERPFPQGLNTRAGIVHHTWWLDMLFTGSHRPLSMRSVALSVRSSMTGGTPSSR